MEYLGINEDELKNLGAIHTAREIQQQPDVWMKVFQLVKGNAGEIKEFMNEAVKDSDEIILTGAGTSAYIGMCLAADYKRNTNVSVQAIATTDLVTHPKNYFSKQKKVLLISFARSGNSPESCAAVELAEKYAARAYHLVITCNEKGNLLNSCSNPLQYNIVLPEETNDVSLAMTSSFTGMLLTGLLVSRISNIENQGGNVKSLIEYGKRILTQYIEDLNKVAQLDFNRVVFLGAGPQIGTATESHLKVQELTDGEVICKSDSFLGLRHGPKAVINPSTLIVSLFSNNLHVLQYENDLIESMEKGQKAMFQIGIIESKKIAEKLKGSIDLKIILSENSGNIDEEFLAICNVLPAQILGTLKSIERGLQPDNPSRSGAISRVVEGVIIYPL
jgi:tagatose-6-phosphate ketose/aldose isomerase